MNPSATAQDSLPFQPLALFVLTLDWFLAVITAVAFLRVREAFPSWFAMPFVMAATVLSLVALLYYWQLSRPPRTLSAPGRLTTAAIWFLLLCSVPCTSALHQFFPFRMDLFEVLPTAPSGFSIIAYNFVLTVASLLVVIALAVLYGLRWRRAALMGIVVLAAVMLIPNDDCGNDFNLPWIRLIGASPLMFAPNAGVLLIGYCALQGILPRASLVFMTLANASVLLLGLGHLTRIVW